MLKKVSSDNDHHHRNQVTIRASARAFAPRLRGGMVVVLQNHLAVIQ